MQPLISPVDHESRHNSYNREHDSGRADLSEQTPLIEHDFVRSQSVEQGHRTTVVVTILLFILVGGVVIGTYLLIEQQRSLPINIPFQLIRREEWDSDASTSSLSLPTQVARHVLVVHTDSEECAGVDTCRTLLRRLQQQHGEIPYNFMVASDGLTYEGLGWRKQSTLFSEPADPKLVLAFIGNFTQSSPSARQVAGARVFVDESINRNTLSPAFTIIGKNINQRSTRLFEPLRRLPEWDGVKSDPMS